MLVNIDYKRKANTFNVDLVEGIFVTKRCDLFYNLLGTRANEKLSASEEML
jgi:hypothetical protein